MTNAGSRTTRDAPTASRWSAIRCTRPRIRRAETEPLATELCVADLGAVREMIWLAFDLHAMVAPIVASAFPGCGTTPMDLKSGLITAKTTGAIGWLTFDNPAKFNPL